MSIEKAEKILLIQLEWVKTADSKVPPLFAINVAMLGIIIALMKTFSNWSIAIAIFVALCLILLGISMVFLALAMFPRMNGPKGSNIFFGCITKKEEATYLKEMMNLRDEDYESDLLGQAYRNAEIAETKYFNIKYAFLSSFVSIPFWLISIYFLYVC